MSSTMGRGYQLFKKENIWKHIPTNREQNKLTSFPPASDKQKNNCDQYFSKEQILFHRTFTSSEIDAVPESEDLCQGTLMHFEKDDYKVIR